MELENHHAIQEIKRDSAKVNVVCFVMVQSFGTLFLYGTSSGSDNLPGHAAVVPATLTCSCACYLSWKITSKIHIGLFIV